MGEKNLIGSRVCAAPPASVRRTALFHRRTSTGRAKDAINSGLVGL